MGTRLPLCLRIFLAAVTAAMLVPAGNAHAQVAELPRVRLQLQWLHQAQFTGFYVASTLGYYEREGIDVELIPGGVGSDGASIDQLKVLREGRADVAVAWLSSALMARRSGF